MNPEEFIKMMNDLPDEMIDSANDSRIEHRRKIWYIIPTVAACFAVLLMAAIYPRIRVQVPNIRSESVISGTTTQPVTNSAISGSTDTSAAYSDTKISGTALSSTDNSSLTTDSSAKTSVTETVTRTEPPAFLTTVTPAETSALLTTVTPIEPPAFSTEIPCETMCSTTQCSCKTMNDTTYTTMLCATTRETLPWQPTGEVPLWKGIIGHTETGSEPHLFCRFMTCTKEADDWTRQKYGIPKEFDFTQNQCLLIEIVTEYSNAVLIDCKSTNRGLHFTVAYLKINTAKKQIIRYAMPIPDSFAIGPENCDANYIEITDEAQLQAMETDRLVIKPISL